MAVNTIDKLQFLSFFIEYTLYRLCLAIMRKHDVINKPQKYITLSKDDKAVLRGNGHSNLLKLGHVVFEIYECGQTYRQTLLIATFHAISGDKQQPCDEWTNHVKGKCKWFLWPLLSCDFSLNLHSFICLFIHS